MILSHSTFPSVTKVTLYLALGVDSRKSYKNTRFFARREVCVKSTENFHLQSNLPKRLFVQR